MRRRYSTVQYRDSSSTVVHSVLLLILNSTLQQVVDSRTATVAVVQCGVPGVSCRHTVSRWSPTAIMLGTLVPCRLRRGRGVTFRVWFEVQLRTGWLIFLWYEVVLR